MMSRAFSKPVSNRQTSLSFKNVPKNFQLTTTLLLINYATNLTSDMTKRIL